MDKNPSLKELLPLIKRGNGKSSYLIDVIIDKLYNEQNKVYGINFPSAATLSSFHDNLMRVIQTTPIKDNLKVCRKNLIETEFSDVKIHLFLNRQTLRGMRFDDVFFDDPSIYLDCELLAETLPYLKEWE